MSKGARNVDIGHFNITQSPGRVQIWVTWARVTNENVKETIDNTYSYANKKYTKFPVMIRSNSLFKKC